MATSTAVAAAAAVGAAVGLPVAGEIVAVASSLFHTSAAGPNADAATQVAAEWAKGNLAAGAAAISRSGIQTQTSAQPWKDLYKLVTPAQETLIRQDFPELNDGFNGWSTWGAIDPTAVLPLVKSRAKYAVTNPTTGTVTTQSTPAGTPAAQTALAGLTPTSVLGWVVLIGVMVALGIAFFKHKGG